jgi:HD-GYP domain-containing protein (c-di-GMP phosphodiesterase class II)
LATEFDQDPDLALDFTSRLLQVLRLVRLCELDNVNLDEPFEALVELVDRIASTAGSACLQVGGDLVFVNRTLVRSRGRAFETLLSVVDAFGQLGLSAIVFGGGLSPSQARSFFGLLKGRPIPGIKHGLRVLDLADRIQIYSLEETVPVTTTEPSAFVEATEPVENREPPAEYLEPPAEYLEPPAEYLEPPAEYLEPPAEYLEPPAEYLEPPAEYLEPESIGPTEPLEPPAEYLEPEPIEVDGAVCREAYARTLVLVREYVRTIHDPDLQRDLSRKLGRALRDLSGLVSGSEDAFVAMGSLKGVDEYLYTHMVNTGFLALALGSRLGIARARLPTLGHAAMLHALGKAKLPLELRENTIHHGHALERLGTHPYLGLETLLATRRPETSTFSVVCTAFQYEAHRVATPVRVKPEDYPVALITRICADYDALTTTLPDRPALTPPAALAHLLGAAGTDYDPAAVAVFGALLGPLPPGTAVWLTTGHVAYVVRTNPEEPLRPVVAMLKDRDRNALRSERFDMTEKGPDGKYLSSIKQVLEQDKLGIDVSEHLLAV